MRAIDIPSSRQEIIVLGRRLAPDGRPCGIFVRRLEKAAEMYREARARGLPARVVITGGDIDRRGITEAGVGRDILRDRLGVPACDLLVEEKALDTIGNAVYTKGLLIEAGCRTPIIVSSCYHIPRVSYIFSHILGPEFEPTYVSAPTGLDPAEYHRHWHSESRKMLEAVEFLDGLDAPPGDHEKVVAFLRRKGLVVEDTVR